MSPGPSQLDDHPHCLNKSGWELAGFNHWGSKSKPLPKETSMSSQVNKSSAWAAAPSCFPCHILCKCLTALCVSLGGFSERWQKGHQNHLSLATAAMQNLVGIAHINSCRLIFVISSSICLWSLQRQIQKQTPRDGHLVCTEINKY